MVRLDALMIGSLSVDITWREAILLLNIPRNFWVLTADVLNVLCLCLLTGKGDLAKSDIPSVRDMTPAAE